MKLRILPFVLVIVGILSYVIFSVIFAKSDIEWSDFIQIDGIIYERNYEMNSDKLENVELDKVYYTIKGMVPDSASDYYKVKNGYSSAYKKGTKVYQVKGYNPEIFIAVKVDNEIIFYEAWIKLLD